MSRVTILLILIALIGPLVMGCSDGEGQEGGSALNLDSSLPVSGSSDAEITTEATIRGIAVLPDLEVDPGEILQVVLYDLAWNEIARDADKVPTYEFVTRKGDHYILIADYSNGTSIGAVTPKVMADLDINITFDTELAMSLIVATEHVTDDLLPASLSRPLEQILADADVAVENLNAFYADRNSNRSADRLAEAVRNLTLDRFNRSLPVYWDDLNGTTLRSYGAGLDAIRSLEMIVSDPNPPLNPHFVFTRYNSNNKVDFGMSDLETKRWDFMGANGGFPHIVTGGDKVVFVKPTSTRIAATNEKVLGVYVRDLGSSISSARLLTPWNMQCWTPSLSPDQTQVAFAGRYIDDPSDIRQAWHPLDIYVVDIATMAITQITQNPGRGVDWLAGCMNPAWSPDGGVLVFEYSQGMDEFADTRLDFVIVDDPESRGVLVEGNGVDGLWRPGQPCFSPDGAQIVFSANVEDSGDIWDYEILAIPADYSFSGGEMRQLTQNVYDDARPDWSYDGRFIIFSSNRGGEPGKSVSQELNPFYVMSAYTGEIIAELGDFANAGYYYGARFCATEAVMAVIDGASYKFSTGEAIISGSDARKSTIGTSDYSYYRETIPAANNIVDAYGSPAYSYGVTSWW